MIVYLVCSGCYSDRHVDGIYTTREKAEAARDRINAPNHYRSFVSEEADIEEWLVDDEASADRPQWEVSWETSASGWSEGCPLRVEAHRWDGGSGLVPQDTYYEWDERCCDLYVRADDEARAIKIASERRAAYLATKGVVRA